MCQKLIAKICLLVLFFPLSMLLNAQTTQPLFKLLPSRQTGIGFTNTLSENDSLNILNQANIYNGGGVGIGDFNNDGLMDVYLAGNMVSNKLYLNKGEMKFIDVTDAAGVGGNGRWCTGVSVVDINNDGLADIYVSASFRKDPLLRTNLLYINQGVKDGNPVFKELASAYGLADTGFSTQGYFFDYDKDGDLDLYLVTNELYDPKTPIRFRPKLKDGSALNTDRLYRNNGNNTFTNVSKEAGIQIEGWGHAASVSDFNLDGWPDVYVANDFVSNDVLYINNRDGTFTDRIGEYFRHTAWNAMGTDVVDINNDGYSDIVSLEMLPEKNLRKKRMLAGNEYYNYFNAAQFDYLHQYVRNVFQLSSGMTPKGHPVFKDVSYLAGVYETDWSWCPLVADFDKDGLRDMIITNGLPRDVTDLDYIAYENGQGGGVANLSLAMAQTLPVVHIPNYAFKNKDGVQFENVSGAWGLDASSFSNGAAYADLDNDGDLDFVINNINKEAFVYENTYRGKDNYLLVTLVGPAQNKMGIGAKVNIYYSGKKLYYEHQPVRGYLSTVDQRAFFGLGNNNRADSLTVLWPDGKTQLITDVDAGNVTVAYKDAAASPIQGSRRVPQLFARAMNKHNISYKPVERDFIDYNIQSTLPHKLSQYGPGIAVGDIDGNGLDDFYVGGSSGNPGKFFLQDEKGNFKPDSTRITRGVNELDEEMGALFFDADNDSDLDLYAVGGSYEIPPNNDVAQDRLFINDGKGYFEKSTDALPIEITNGSCVRAADYDGDGDLDLFVGGRVVSGAYPKIPESSILQNDGGKFTDVTDKVCPRLRTIGMVTDALWTDFNNDGKPDLLLSGEWMPLTFLQNTGNAFVLNNASGIEQQHGWWNSLAAGDFDNDGDIDYVAGNLGLNSNYKATASEPMTLYAKDIDKNGSLDAMLFCYLRAEDNSKKPFPMHAREDLSSQLVSIRKKYPTYKSYGLATMNDLWPEAEKQEAIEETANELRSCFVENKGNGRFVLKALPLMAQSAPLFGMIGEDFDNDGNLDLLLVGNDYGMEPYSGRHDAFSGLFMKGDGRGNFETTATEQSGFFVDGDAKALARIQAAGNKSLWIATQNQDSIIVHELTQPAKDIKWIDIQPQDFAADIEFKNGRRRRVEFYYGSTFLSQSTRKFPASKQIKKMTITNFAGKKRNAL